MTDIELIRVGRKQLTMECPECGHWIQIQNRPKCEDCGAHMQVLVETILPPRDERDSE